MGVERLPSGKFDTNELVLELTMIVYNILRMLGQETVDQGKAPAKRIVRCERIRYSKHHSFCRSTHKKCAPTVSEFHGFG